MIFLNAAVYMLLMDMYSGHWLDKEKLNREKANYLLKKCVTKGNPRSFYGNSVIKFSQNCH